MLLLKAAWGASCYCFTPGVVFQFPLRADWHVKTDGYIVNHFARHASVRQHVVCMGERFRCQKFTVRIQLFPKTMGDWLSGTSGRKYPNQYESWIRYASKNRLADSHPTVLHLAPGFTRPRGLMPPVKDPGHHLCWLSHVTCQYMPHAISYHFCLCGGVFGWYSHILPKPSQTSFFGHFCLKGKFFQKLWSWPTSPHRCLASAAQMVNIYRELIEAAKPPRWLRSNLRLPGELKFALL